jgi:hypothetical protein
MRIATLPGLFSSTRKDWQAVSASWFSWIYGWMKDGRREGKDRKNNCGKRLQLLV